MSSPMFLLVSVIRLSSGRCSSLVATFAGTIVDALPCVPPSSAVRVLHHPGTTNHFFLKFGSGVLKCLMHG